MPRSELFFALFSAVCLAIGITAGVFTVAVWVAAVSISEALTPTQYAIAGALTIAIACVSAELLHHTIGIVREANKVARTIRTTDGWL